MLSVERKIFDVLIQTKALIGTSGTAISFSISYKIKFGIFLNSDFCPLFAMKGLITMRFSISCKAGERV